MWPRFFFKERRFVMKDIIDQKKKKKLLLSWTLTGGIARGEERRSSRETAGVPSLSI